jgi:hypothetical protein
MCIDGPAADEGRGTRQSASLQTFALQSSFLPYNRSAALFSGREDLYCIDSMFDGTGRAGRRSLCPTMSSSSPLVPSTKRRKADGTPVTCHGSNVAYLCPGIQFSPSCVNINEFYRRRRSRRRRSRRLLPLPTLARERRRSGPRERTRTRSTTRCCSTRRRLIS